MLVPTRQGKGRARLHCLPMGPLVQVAPGPGQLRALGCSYPGTESTVEWCGTDWMPHHGAGSGPGCFPEEGAMWEVPEVPHTSCLVFLGSPPLLCPPVLPGAHCTMILLLSKDRTPWIPNRGVIQTQ